MYYKHNLTKYKYPEQCDEHMITVKRVRKLNFDENYRYLDKRFSFKLKKLIYFPLLYGVVFPITRIVHGLKVYGKENLKKNKELFKDGAITICNHVCMWDYLCMLNGIRPYAPYFPVWKNNVEGPMGPLIRMSGGIPVPDNVKGMAKFNEAIEEVLSNNKWLHFFPEGSMWFFYPDIRPLKKAVFRYAVKFDKPIIPITMSMRPRKGIMRLFLKTPCIDMHIGEPLLVNKDLVAPRAVEDLRSRAYHVMQVMNGITPDSPTYNTDLNPFNYKKTM